MAQLGSTRLWSLVTLCAALLFVAGVALLVVGAPRGYVGYRTAFDALRVLGTIGAVACLLSIALLVYAIKSRQRMAQTMSGLATLLFAVPVATMAVNQGKAPAGRFINDITTDLDDPPTFSAVVALRPPGSNPIEYGGEAVASRQRELYPDLAPIYTELTGEPAFRKAFETAEAMGWEIVSADLQGGTIEAVATTRFFRFKDDVVIRIRPTPSGSRIDLRSRSRIGASDLGKNASRIRKYIKLFESRTLT